MKTRTIIGIVAGIVAWWCLFYVVSILLAVIWPDFAQAGSLALQDRDYSAFTATMLVVLLGVWGSAYVGGGWVTVLITRKRLHTFIMASPWFLYLAFMHLYYEWSSFPPWYNLGVVLLVFPLAWFGGGLVRLGKGSAGSEVHPAGPL